MEAGGNVMWHLGASDLLEGVGIEDEQERIALLRIQYDGENYAIVFFFSLRSLDEDRLARIAVFFRPDGCGALAHIDPQQEAGNGFALLIIGP